MQYLIRCIYMVFAYFTEVIMEDKELENIIGGEIFDIELFMGFVSIIAVIVAILKLYMSMMAAVTKLKKSLLK